VNSDGKVDLVISATSLATLQTKIYTLHNKANKGADFSGQSFNEMPFALLFSENIHLNDVNQDGMPDLLVGKSNGAIEHWKNNGPAGTLNFTLFEEDFLGLGPSIERQSPAITTSDLNGDGKAELIFGDQYGLVHIIDDFRNGRQEPVVFSDIILDPLSKTYTTKKLGGRTWPSVGNLFNTNKTSIVVGNILGGLHILRNDEGASLPEEIQLEIYPVPLERSQSLNIKIDRYASAQLISTLGQSIGEPFSILPNQITKINLSTVSPGVYLVRVMANNRTFVRRIVVY
jgi:hypothetical protein